METGKVNTPSKSWRTDSPLINNLLAHRTPMKQHENRPKRTMYHQNNTLTVLPSHITPPSKMKEFIIKNPFEPDLTNRLHMSVISPTVFTKIESPLQGSPQFTWNIDELAHIKPAKIEEFPVHQIHSPDPGLEVKAQAAINQFFKKNQIIPSPWDDRQQDNKPCIPLDTPNRPLDDINSSKELSKSKKDVWCQTVLSLPLSLPQNVEEVLKPFFTFTQDQKEQSTDNEEANVSNNSLRRKLFFTHDERGNNDEECIESLSPLKASEPMRLSCSPPQSGMFVHGTPLKMLRNRQQSDECMMKLENLSPPNMSPIFNIKNDIRVESCSRSTIRLDFMDISMNDVPEEKKQSPSEHSQWVLDTSLNENGMKDNRQMIIINNDKRTLCDSINMEELAKCVNSNDCTRRCDGTMLNENRNDANFKFKTEMESFMREERKQITTMFSSFDHQNSNAVQDTGYQTYMNNTMQVADSYSNTSAYHKPYANERLTTFKDNTQLSWKENIKKVFSSTPSKANNDN